MCFYGQTSISNGAVTMIAGQGRADYTLKLGAIDADVEKIVFTATIDGAPTFGQLADVRLEAPGQFTATIPAAGKTEKALILGEAYRRQGAWKFRLLGQGFNGGLAALATHFGVEVADAQPEPTPAAPPPPQPKPASSVNLSKVTLTKQDSKISLKKDDGRFGKIRINLNWNQKTTQKKGLFGLGGSRGLDLDVGAMVEFNTGSGDKAIDLIQALGNRFGAYDQPPFIRLLADDRTGASTDGEWIEINGDMWQHFKRVLIYTFIYEGAPNWQETDGVVRVLVPNQPEIEVRMNEYGSRQPACAIALLENDGGQIRVSREVLFFDSQKPMDDHYRWGFNWTRGSK